MSLYQFKNEKTRNKLHKFNPRNDFIFLNIIEGALLRLKGVAWARINKDLEKFCDLLERETGQRYANLDCISVIETLHDYQFQSLPGAIKANDDFLILTGTSIFDENRCWPENPIKVLREQASLSRRDMEAEVKEALLGLMIAFVRGTGNLPTVQKGVDEDLAILRPKKITFTALLVDLLPEFPVKYRKGASLLTHARRVLTQNKKIISQIMKCYL